LRRPPEPSGAVVVLSTAEVEPEAEGGASRLEPTTTGEVPGRLVAELLLPFGKDADALNQPSGTRPVRPSSELRVFDGAVLGARIPTRCRGPILEDWPPSVCGLPDTASEGVTASPSRSEKPVDGLVRGLAMVAHAALALALEDADGVEFPVTASPRCTLPLPRLFGLTAFPLSRSVKARRMRVRSA